MNNSRVSFTKSVMIRLCNIITPMLRERSIPRERPWCVVLWLKSPKCRPTASSPGNTSIPLEWLKPNMSHFRHLQTMLPLMCVCVCVCERESVCRYVHHSSVPLLLGQDDYDDSSLKMKRKYPLCFLHHISHETAQRVCVWGVVWL